MFDLERDPRELNSVYSEPEYAAVRRGLRLRLAELQQGYEDDVSLSPAD